MMKKKIIIVTSVWIENYAYRLINNFYFKESLEYIFVHKFSNDIKRDYYENIFGFIFVGQQSVDEFGGKDRLDKFSDLNKCVVWNVDDFLITYHSYPIKKKLPIVHLNKKSYQGWKLLHHVENILGGYVDNIDPHPRFNDFVQNDIKKDITVLCYINLNWGGNDFTSINNQIFELPKKIKLYLDERFEEHKTNFDFDEIQEFYYLKNEFFLSSFIAFQVLRLLKIKIILWRRLKIFEILSDFNVTINAPYLPDQFKKSNINFIKSTNSFDTMKLLSRSLFNITSNFSNDYMNDRISDGNNLSSISIIEDNSFNIKKFRNSEMIFYNFDNLNSIISNIFSDKFAYYDKKFNKLDKMDPNIFIYFLEILNNDYLCGRKINDKNYV